MKFLKTCQLRLDPGWRTGPWLEQLFLKRPLDPGSQFKKYNNLTITDKCVQIFTYDVAIPYLLKKPSCNKYFFLWNIGNKKNQNLFIESIENRKPNFILLLDGGLEKLNYEKIPTFFSPSKMLPIIHNFIMENYYLNENVLHWNIYELKSS